MYCRFDSIFDVSSGIVNFWVVLGRGVLFCENKYEFFLLNCSFLGDASENRPISLNSVNVVLSALPRGQIRFLAGTCQNSKLGYGRVKY